MGIWGGIIHDMLIGLGLIVGILAVVVFGLMAYASHVTHERCRRGHWS